MDQIILFHAVSDRLLFLRDGAIAANPLLQGKTVDDDISPAIINESRKRMLANALAHVRYATQQGLRVRFGC